MNDSEQQASAGRHPATEWDVAVIGGGPAGMMAAGTAAAKGARVILLEKNDSLGRKLLITGGGRCNVTNGELDTRELLKKFRENDKFLFSAFSKWSIQETLDFFHTRGMPTKEEKEKRVFPASEKSSSVLNVLLEFLRAGKVTVMSNAPVKKIHAHAEKAPSAKHDGKTVMNETRTDGVASAHVTGIELKDGSMIRAKAYILATGGTSRPETGSTGDGFVWLRQLGHKVAEPEASLVPVAIDEDWLKEVQGVTLPNAKISVVQNNEKQATLASPGGMAASVTSGGIGTKGGSRAKPKTVHEGKVLFTHFGVSGPTILNMSRDIGEIAKYGDTYISLDIMPSMDHGRLNKALNDLFRTESNKKFKNCLGLIDPSIPKAIINVIVRLSGINPDVFAHSITREERLALIDTLKNLRMRVKGLLGKDKAIVSSGGVSLEEVDFKTMQSRLYPNLHLIGDVLDIDRPSGGYSLQICWTTGHVAGSSAASA